MLVVLRVKKFRHVYGGTFFMRQQNGMYKLLMASDASEGFFFFKGFPWL
jgi:hypothetical protein